MVLQQKKIEKISALEKRVWRYINKITANNSFSFLESTAKKIRETVITTIIEHGEGHLGSALSAVEIITALYFQVMKIDPQRPDWEEDRFILSGGHKCLALYGALALRGYFPLSDMARYNKLGSTVPGHPDAKKLAGIDFSTGSLGHGLSVGLGVALSGKRFGGNYKVFVLMGDGEQGKGSVWEAALSAGYNQVDNLVAVVDRNRLQVNGSTEQVLTRTRWRKSTGHSAFR
ncbi:MAG: transketolase [Bacillota bacterium]